MPARPERRARAPRPGASRLAAAVGYGAAEAWTAFRRNGLMSLAAVLTIMVTLLLVGAGAHQQQGHHDGEDRGQAHQPVAP
ncbi:MAG: hypothetical protein HY334_06970, partial [Armatimonadetes bacterium]|nr:hypothetical protein [Armatimonadota bacterium]